MLVFFPRDSPRGMKTPPSYRTLLERLTESLVPQRDKPEETPEATLRALWSVAAGSPLSARRAALETPGSLDDAGAATLAGLVERRLSGIPLRTSPGDSTSWGSSSSRARER